jgi:hypothetical protein
MREARKARSKFSFLPEPRKVVNVHAHIRVTPNQPQTPQMGFLSPVTMFLEQKRKENHSFAWMGR